MTQDQLLDADTQVDADLERRIVNSMHLEKGMSLPKEILPKDKKLAPGKYSPDNLDDSLRQNIGSYVRNAASFASRKIKDWGGPALTLLAGGLPYKYQKAIESKLGEDKFRAQTATLINVLYITPLMYSGIGAFAGYQALGTEGMVVGSMLGMGFWALSSVLRILRIETSKTSSEMIVGEPLVSALTLPYEGGKNLGKFMLTHPYS